MRITSTNFKKEVLTQVQKIIVSVEGYSVYDLVCIILDKIHTRLRTESAVLRPQPAYNVSKNDEDGGQ